MKRFLPIIALMTIALCVKGQELTDQEAIIQQCIDLTELQHHFPRESNENFIPVHIMQYPMQFDEALNVKKFGVSPVFMSREEIYDNNVDAYFLFKEIDGSDNGGWANFSFYYNYNSEKQHVMHVSLELEKIKGKWVIINSDIQNF